MPRDHVTDCVPERCELCGEDDCADLTVTIDRTRCCTTCQYVLTHDIAA